MDILVALIVLVVWIAMGGVGAYVAVQKQREPIEGLLFALLLGPIGILIEVLLPEGKRRVVTERPTVFAETSDLADDAQAQAFLGSIEPKRPKPKPLTKADLPAWLQGDAATDPAELARREAEAIERMSISEDRLGMSPELPEDFPPPERR